ncbi:MAG: TolC family protein [Candidatus Cloacimonetes bacterium]|nr:TolC family protein [Candidatus Cloacimonadota bacterium]
MNKYIVMTIMIALALGLGAQEDAFAGLGSISLRQAQEQAIKQNSAYAAKEAAYSSAKWGKTNAISTVLPTLSLSGTYLYMDPATTYQSGSQTTTLNNDMRTISLNLSQPLFLGGKAWQAYKMSVTSEEMAKLSLQNQRFVLLSEVESKYLAALQLKVLYNISLQEITSAKNNLELAGIKQDSGILSRADYLRFQSRLAGKQVSGLQAQTALQLALQDLANYLGAEEMIMPEEISMESEAALIERLDAYDMVRTNALSDKLLQLALTHNINYRILGKSVELSERAYTIAKASFLPTLMLTGSRQYKENGIDRYEFTASNQIMLNASLPILPGLGYYSAAQKAKEEARKAALEAKTATDGIKLGIEASTLNWISSAKQVKSAELGLAYTEELYSQMQERFRLNMLSSLELLDAELMLSAARMTYTNAFYGYLKSRSALMQALALEDKTELYTLMEN